MFTVWLYCIVIPAGHIIVNVRNIYNLVSAFCDFCHIHFSLSYMFVGVCNLLQVTLVYLFLIPFFD